MLIHSLITYVVIQRDWYSLLRQPRAREVVVTSTSNRTITGLLSLQRAASGSTRHRHRAYGIIYPDAQI